MSFINAFLNIIGQGDTPGSKLQAEAERNRITAMEQSKMPTIEKREAWFVGSKSFNSEAEAKKYIINEEFHKFAGYTEKGDYAFAFVQSCRSRIEQYYRELDAGMTDIEREAKEMYRRNRELVNDPRTVVSGSTRKDFGF